MDKIQLYVIENEFLRAEILNYGATVHKLIDKKMNRELILSYDSLDDYIDNHFYLNSICGPTAGRIANGEYDDGKLRKLSKNNGENHLHGGLDSYARKYFDVDSTDTKVVLTLKTVNKEYPGEQDIKIMYEVSDNDFVVSFEADTNHIIPMNLTSHMYFTGFGNESVLMNQMKLESNERMILNDMTPVGFMKYDHYLEKNDITEWDDPFILNGENPAIVYYGKDLTMEVITDYDTVVIYTQNGTGGKFDKPHMGICFETQKVPNGVNVEGYDAMLDNEHYKHQTIYRFRR